MTIARAIVEAIAADPVAVDVLRRAFGIVAAAGPEPDVYRSDGELPRGYSRRRFRETAPKIPGAQRAGGKRGRGVAWVVKRSDFEAWLTKQSQPTEKAPEPASNVVDLDGWIEAAGFRATRGAK